MMHKNMRCTSMTAYASIEAHTSKGSVCLKLKSVNAKGFRLALYLKASFKFESDIKKLILEKINRGTVDFSIEFDGTENRGSDFSTWIKECEKEGLPIPTWSDYFVKQQISTKNEIELDVVKQEIQPLIKTLIENYLSCAEEEGQSMLVYLKQYLDNIKESLQEIKKHLPELHLKKVDDLKNRVQKISEEMNLTIQKDLTQECAVLLEKCDVQEEVDRLDTHCDLFKKIVTEDWRGGKYLDFLCQEINREINTLGTKSQSTQMSTLCISMKSDLEKMREQVQNFA